MYMYMNKYTYYAIFGILNQITTGMMTDKVCMSDKTHAYFHDLSRTHSATSISEGQTLQMVMTTPSQR